MNYQKHSAGFRLSMRSPNIWNCLREDVIIAQEASRTPSSIHETVYENDGDPITLLDQIDDGKEGKWFDKIALKEAIRELDERERLIVYLRYYKDQTQSEVADRLGISQVQVSRLEKKILQTNERTNAYRIIYIK